jgi:hypothetical protein
MLEDIEKTLFVFESGKYGDKYIEHLLEQYKIYVGSAEKISEQRQKANEFFLAVNTALVAILVPWIFIAIYSLLRYRGQRSYVLPLSKNRPSLDRRRSPRRRSHPDPSLPPYSRIGRGEADGCPNALANFARIYPSLVGISTIDKIYACQRTS